MNEEEKKELRDRVAEICEAAKVLYDLQGKFEDDFGIRVSADYDLYRYGIGDGKWYGSGYKVFVMAGAEKLYEAFDIEPEVGENCIGHMERNGISKDGKYVINDIADKNEKTGEWEFTPARKPAERS